MGHELGAEWMNPGLPIPGPSAAADEGPGATSFVWCSWLQALRAKARADSKRRWTESMEQDSE